MYLSIYLCIIPRLLPMLILLGCYAQRFRTVEEILRLTFEDREFITFFESFRNLLRTKNFCMAEDFFKYFFENDFRV